MLCLWSSRYALRRLIFRDIFSTLRRRFETQRERKREAGREREREKEREDTVDNFAKHEAKRRAISTFTRCVTKKTKDAEETLIRAHSITRIKPLVSRSESFQRRTRRFELDLFSLFSLFLSSFFFLPSSFFFPPPSHIRLPLLSSSLSAVFITHRRHGARLHYTHIHSTVASLEKSGIKSLSRQRTQRRHIPRVFFVPQCSSSAILPCHAVLAFSYFLCFPFRREKNCSGFILSLSLSLFLRVPFPLLSLVYSQIRVSAQQKKIAV